MRNFIFLLPLFLILITGCKKKKEISDYNDNQDYQNILPVNTHRLEALVPGQCTGIDQANWEHVGPQKYIDSKGQWHGFVWTILGDERNYPQNLTDNILIGTAGSGLWRFEKNHLGEKEWVCKSDKLNLQGLRINDIVRNPCNPNHILAATGMFGEGSTTFGSGVISSNDNGESWQKEDIGKYKLSYDHAVLRVVFDKFKKCKSKQGSYYILSQNSKKYHLGYFNNGKYFECNLPEFKSSHYEIYDIELVGEGILLLSDRNKFGREASVYRSTDGARTWKKIIDQLPDFPMNSKGVDDCARCAPNRSCYCRPVRIGISEENAGNVFLYMSNQMFYESNDRGASWKRLPISNLSRVDNNKIDILQSPHSGSVYFGGVQPWIWNGENRYPYRQGHDDVRDYFILGYNEQTKEESVLLANDGGVSLVTHNTETKSCTWKDVCGESFPISQLWGIGVAQSTEENYVIGVMHCNSFHFDGKEWEKIGGGDGGGCLIDPLNKENYFASGNPRLTKYGGERPKKAYQNNKWFLGSPVKLHPANANLIYMGRNKDRGDDCNDKSFAHLIIYNDEDESVQKKAITNCDFTYAHAIGLSLSNPKLVYVGADSEKGATPGKVLKSEDNGESWVDLSASEVRTENGDYMSLSQLLAWKSVKDILINPFDEKEIYLCISNHYAEKNIRIHEKLRVIKSTDGGRSWIDFSKGLPSVSANCFLYQHHSPDRIFLGTELGIYYTEDGWDNWQCYNNGLPNVSVTEMEINYCRNELYAGTYGRGLWRTSLDLPEWRKGLEIKGNQVWTADRVIWDDIIIKKGATLRISGECKIAPKVRIYLEKNASINFDKEAKCLCDDASDCYELIQLD